MVLGYKATVDNLPSMQGIPGAMVSDHLIGSTLNNPVEPIVVSLSQLGTSLNDRYMNALVQLDHYEFSSTDTLKTYGDTSSYKSTVNRNINTGCGSNINVVVRTSGYASFTGVPIPRGNGSIAAIYTIYKSSPTSNTSTKQFLLRDVSDVHFDSARCGSSVNPNPTGARITIAQLRALYTGNNIKLTTANSISGVVTSDAANKNISTGAVVIQDESGAAITVYIGGTLTYSLGDSIAFDIINDSLLNYRGSLELKTTVGTTAPAPIATGRVVTPLVKTIAELNTSLSAALGSSANLELVVVKINNASASGSATFSGSNTLTDASGTITLYTSSTALFSGTSLPSGARNWTGQVKNYNGTTKEFLIRNTNDVQ
jgi:hypothetical protein